jgi:hypothetical protein
MPQVVRLVLIIHGSGMYNKVEIRVFKAYIKLQKNLLENQLKVTDFHVHNLAKR